MGVISRVFLLSVLVLLITTEAHGLLCNTNSDCPGFLDNSDEDYCCGTAYYSYCCDITSWLEDAFRDNDDVFDDDDDDDWFDDDHTSNYDGAGSFAIGIILAITFGVIGFIVLVVVCVLICVCCVANSGQRRNTTTTVYHPQAVPVAMSATGNTTTGGVPYYPTQPPPYVNYTTNYNQGGHVTAKY